MKKILSLFLLFVMLFSLVSCTSSEGSYIVRMCVSTQNDTSFSMNYDYFDGYKKYTIEAKAGSDLRFIIKTNSGQISLKIEDYDHDIIFEKENMNPTSGYFTLEKGGKYMITITAVEHSGSLEFAWD